MDHGNNSSQMNTKQLGAKLFQLQNAYIYTRWPKKAQCNFFLNIFVKTAQLL